MERQHTPYAIVAKVAFSALRTMRLPEALVPHAQTHGWSVLIRDSEMPAHVPDSIWSPMSRTERRTWLDERDVRDRDRDEDDGHSPDDRYR